MKSLLLLAGVIALTRLGTSQMVCREDSECESLGKELVCVKSACEWGTCGCRAGRTAKFVGSGPGKNFKCVPNRKIGKECSTEGDEGVCLAPNSYCDLASNRCKCKTNYVPAWGGEACVSEAYETDTCDLASGSLSTCGTSPNTACFGTPNYPAFKMGTGTCTCPAGQRLDFVMLHGHTSFWYGPHCRQIRIGERCLLDTDCPNSGKKNNGGSYISGGNCDTNNKCVCESGQVANYDKSRCRQALSFGDTCRSSTVPLLGDKTCNGESGLVCGDICDVKTYYRTITTSQDDAKCVCGPFHRTSSTTCNPIGIGGSCYGDYNCKGIGPRAVCVDGTCQNAGRRLVSGWLLSSLLPVILYLLTSS